MKLPRSPLKVGMKGTDVQGVKRSVARYLGGDRLHSLMSKPAVVQRTFGPFFKKDVNAARKKLGMTQTGQVDQIMWTRLEKAGAPDDLAYAQIEQYALDNPPPSMPLGTPSLDRSLWVLYDMAMDRGFTDLGTYNPASMLPSGKPSDHALWPALAFDAGFSPATGMANTKARDFFHLCVGRPEVEYVICGNKIWSRDRGLHNYIESYSHAGHVHVSGRR